MVSCDADQTKLGSDAYMFILGVMLCVSGLAASVLKWWRSAPGQVALWAAGAAAVSAVPSFMYVRRGTRLNVPEHVQYTSKGPPKIVDSGTGKTLRMERVDIASCKADQRFKMLARAKIPDDPEARKAYDVIKKAARRGVRRRRFTSGTIDDTTIQSAWSWKPVKNEKTERPLDSHQLRTLFCMAVVNVGIIEWGTEECVKYISNHHSGRKIVSDVIHSSGIVNHNGVMGWDRLSRGLQRFILEYTRLGPPLSMQRIEGIEPYIMELNCPGESISFRGDRNVMKDIHKFIQDTIPPRRGPRMARPAGVGLPVGAYPEELRQKQYNVEEYEVFQDPNVRFLFVETRTGGQFYNLSEEHRLFAKHVWGISEPQPINCFIGSEEPQKVGMGLRSLRPAIMLPVSTAVDRLRELTAYSDEIHLLRHVVLANIRLDVWGSIDRTGDLPDGNYSALEVRDWLAGAIHEGRITAVPRAVDIVLQKVGLQVFSKPIDKAKAVEQLTEVLRRPSEDNNPKSRPIAARIMANESVAYLNMVLDMVPVRQILNDLGQRGTRYEEHEMLRATAEAAWPRVGDFVLLGKEASDEIEVSDLSPDEQDRLRQNVLNLQRLTYGVAAGDKSKTTMEQELAELRSQYRTSMLVQCLMQRLGRVSKITEKMIQVQLIFPVCPLTEVNTPTRHVIVATLDLPRHVAVYLYREQEELAETMLTAEMQVGQGGDNQQPLIIGGGVAPRSSGRALELNFEAIARVKRNGGVAEWFWTKFISTIGSVENENRRSMGNVEIMEFDNFSISVRDADFDARNNDKDGVTVDDPVVTRDINDAIQNGGENVTRWVRLNKQNEFKCKGASDWVQTGAAVVITPVLEAATNTFSNVTNAVSNPYFGAAAGAIASATLFGPGVWSMLLAGLGGGAGGAAAKMASDMNSWNGKVIIYGCTSSMETYFRDTTPRLNDKISWTEWMRSIYDQARSNIGM